MEKLILSNSFSPGDVVLLTGAVRDLHLCYPNRFLTDVRTPFPELWEHNPYLTPLSESDPDVRVLNCHYPLIDKSNYVPNHVLFGFVEFLNHTLGVHIQPTAFKGDIYLSKEEMQWDSQVHELVGADIPFWIVVAGGKPDITIKWWDPKRFQRIVDEFQGKVQFVQVGAEGHHHPTLREVIDLRRKTSLRQLIRLVYHAQGVVCPVTLCMHLAAAVRVKGDRPKNRPCVVIAGGREPAQWEAYPHHQFMHTNGSLLCCDQGGCWKSRTVPIGDGHEHDQPHHLCVNVVRGRLPKCMDMITANAVAARIRSYFEGGAISFLTNEQARAAAEAVSIGERLKWNPLALEVQTLKRAVNDYVRNISEYSGTSTGRGIVICAGGEKYFPSAWVCIRMLRHLGCSLPVELWYLGPHELDAEMIRLLKPYDVECRDASATLKKHAARLLSGYGIKPYAIIHSSFREVLLLDADNVPVRNPEFLFDTPQFRKTGAVFWPDIRAGLPRKTWRVFGVKYHQEPEFESGQILVDKIRAWKALLLTMWYNEHADVYYRFVLGDKDTFHMSFRKLKAPFAWVPHPPALLRGAMGQHWFDGTRLFQHRNTDKWRLDLTNARISGFEHESECFSFLRQLRSKWDGKVRRSTLHPQKRIVLRAPINSYTGYGLHATQIVSDLTRSGYEVIVRPTAVAEKFAKVPGHIRKRFVDAVQSNEWELMLHPPNVAPTNGKKTVYFTMWEATRLPKEWVGFLNQAECIVVPCQWNASCFSASGVTKPIKVTPLGIKPRIFRYRPMDMKGPCVFGAAARMEGGGRRKGLNEVVELFRKAFPYEHDVRLRVKAFPDCDVGGIQDSRIDIARQYYTEPELAAWYESLTCFVSLSRSEGWGLMPHQAMAVGRPCITVKFGGQAEFFSQAVGYPVRFELVPAEYNYAGGGHWAQFDERHVIELMRHVYRAREEVRDLGRKASLGVSEFTWQASNKALLAILQELGMVS